MQKFGKTAIIASAALVAALSVSSLASVMAGAQEETIVVPKGFESEAVDIAGANEALLGWQYYFYNDKDAAGNDRGFSYESENLHVLATENGRTGNALHLKRDHRRVRKEPLCADGK